MKLLVDRIDATPSDHGFEVSPGWLEARIPQRDDGDGADGGRVEGPLRVELHAHRIGESLLLEGEATGALSLACGRCLTRYRAPIREAFRLVLEPAAGRVPADPEGAEALREDGLVLSDELEAGWFDGSEIDLGRFVIELVALGWPVQPVCREDCLGLCPRCGADRNDNPCDCEAETRVSPFAVLEQLKGRLAAPGSEEES